MAVNSGEEITLAFFVTECRGVTFYDIKDGKGLSFRLLGGLTT